VKPVYLADLSLSPLLTGAVTTFEMISRYPSVKRDIAVVVPEDTSWGGVQACLESVHDERLRAIELFDVYRGDSIGKELKSFALSLTFQAKDSTLDESEIAGLMVMIMTRLKTELGATIRE
jgi:phenylalanyl-tRNA synthetase beta chain